MPRPSRTFRSTAEKSGALEAAPSRVYYPHISLTSEQLPEAKNWEVGKTYEAMIKMKQVGVHKHEGEDARFEFEIVGIKTGNSSHNKKKSRYV